MRCACGDVDAGAPAEDFKLKFEFTSVPAYAPGPAHRRAAMRCGRDGVCAGAPARDFKLA
jgi:hypothetical protein